MPVKKTTKEEIMVKSALLFKEKGYFNTSISDLSKECGVHNANIYYYFTDKENLMEESLKYVHEVFLTKAIRVAYDESLTPKQRVEKMLRKLEKLFLSNEGGCLMGNLALEISHIEPKFMDVIRNFFKDWAAGLTHLFKFIYNEEEAREMAEMTIQDVEGGIMMYKLYKEKSFITKALQRAEKHFR
jgi:AcrR family transcriptional regulator